MRNILRLEGIPARWWKRIPKATRLLFESCQKCNQPSVKVILANETKIMSDLISTAKEKALAFWAMGFWFVFFTITSLSIALLGALIGADWQSIGSQGRFMIGLAVINSKLDNVVKTTH